MKYLFLILTLLLSSSASAKESKKKTICLNMIIKDEAQVIEKCLNSVKPLIDYWVIVDTGSTDTTKEIVKKTMAGIPGELHEKPWENFAHNRNEALTLAKNKGDYLLLIDADEILQFSSDFSLPCLEKDLYYILVRQVGLADSKRNGLINNHLNWTWKGVIHEALFCPEMKESEVLKGVFNLCNTHEGGASGRSKESEKTKYLRDAAILEKALKEEPNNSRYAYYLGISYSATENYELAKLSFEKRLQMPSSDFHETFMTLYNIGLMEEKLNEWDKALNAFSKAHTFHPTRAEPLFHMAVIYRKRGDSLLGYLLTKYALTFPIPEEDLCYEYITYDSSLLIEFANCALLLGKYDEAFYACNKLLGNPNLPSEYKASIQSNYEIARKNLISEKRNAPSNK